MGNDTSTKKEKSTMREVVSMIVYIAAVVVIALLLNRFVIQKVEVDGPSMNTTLASGQQLIVEKVSYRFSDPKRFDIVVFTPPGYEDDTLYIKRIIGLPGDTVQVIDGAFYVNGEKLEDPYWSEYIEDAGIAEDVITVPEGEYFVVGDNRNNSKDSREFETIKRDSIMGKAVLRLWPFSKFGLLD